MHTWGHPAPSWDGAGFQSRAGWLQTALFSLRGHLPEGQTQTGLALIGKADLRLCFYFNISAAACHLTVCKAYHVNYLGGS